MACRPLTALGSILAMLVTACGPSADVAVPPGVRGFVEGARAALVANQDGLDRSSFRLVAARCREDGGVLFLFEQSSPTEVEGLAVAISGDPSSSSDTWAGGYAPVDPASDPEVRAFFRETPEIPCP